MSLTDVFYPVQLFCIKKGLVINKTANSNFINFLYISYAMHHYNHDIFPFTVKSPDFVPQPPDPPKLKESSNSRQSTPSP